MPLNTVEVTDVVWFKGVAYPRDVRFRNIIITGPPGSGKSSLVQKLGGWPEEGYIDLAKSHWWRSRILTFRPREVHFAVPFRGTHQSFSVIDPVWLANPAPIDFRRIQVPPGKSHFFEINWRARFIFDFQLPLTEKLLAARKDRSTRKTHPVDNALSEEVVEHQHSVYEQLARHFHRCGMRVIVRTDYAGMPRVITETDEF